MKSPLLRPVSFQDSAGISPWPARLLGLEAWRKTERNPADVLREYDQGYQELVQKWDEFSHRRQPLTGFDALHFMRLQTRSQCRALVTNPIYRSSTDDYLVSSGDELFAMNLELAIELSRSMQVSYLLDLQCEVGFSHVVETGCGTGHNLLLLSAYLRLKSCIGGDICPGAVQFVERVWRDCGLPGRAQEYSYLQPNDLASLTRGLDDYILITAHSVEQVQLRDSRFAESLAALPNPPRRVVHFEPILDPDDKSPGSALRHKYAEINHYNTDLLVYLRDCEQRRLLQITDYIPSVFGVSAFNPTSILQWQVCR